MEKGKFTEVRVDATINLGSYNSEKIGVTYAMTETEDIFSIIGMCKDVVYGRQVATDVKVEVKETPKTEEVKVTKPKAAKPVEAPKAEIKAEEPKVEEVKAEEPKAEPKAKRTVTAKVKNTPYDRFNESHKRLLSSFLDKQKPNWKNKGEIEKAAEASKKLTEAKEDFLDGDGVILESFKEKFMSMI